MAPRGQVVLEVNAMPYVYNMFQHNCDRFQGDPRHLPTEGGGELCQGELRQQEEQESQEEEKGC